MENEKDTVFWTVDSQPDKPYDTTTWYRCVGGQDFVKKIQEKHRIMGIVFSGNNLGFILEEK